MDNSDSDYQCSIVSDTESESTIDSIYLLYELTEDDWLDLYETIDELVVELLTEKRFKNIKCKYLQRYFYRNNEYIIRIIRTFLFRG